LYEMFFVLENLLQDRGVESAMILLSVVSALSLLQGQALYTLPRRAYVEGESTKYVSTVTITGDRKIVFTIRSTETVKRVYPQKGAVMEIVTDSMGFTVNGEQKPALKVMPRTINWDIWQRIGSLKMSDARTPGGMDPLGYADILPPDGTIREGGTPVDFQITQEPNSEFHGTWNYKASGEFVFISLKGYFQAEGRKPVNVAYEVKLDGKTGKALRIESQADSWIQNNDGRLDVQRGTAIHTVREIVKD